MVGDGTYMMMNSDIYSSVLTGHKMIVVVCDNGGYRRDQPAAERQGRRLLQQHDRGLPGEGTPFAVDFAKHAEVDGRAGAAVSRASPTSARPWNGPRPPTARPF